MKRALLACVGSSLVTAVVLVILGAGPLDPPTGPVAPTGVSLDQLAATLSAATPGNNVPGRLLVGGGTATLVYSDRTVTLPLIGYSLFRQGGTAATIAIAFEAGTAGARLNTGAGGSIIPITIVGSDGTTIGPVTVVQSARSMVNGPTAGGNKAIYVVYFSQNLNGVPVPLTDSSGSGVY